MNLLDLLDARVREHPDAVAVEDDSGSLTFAELSRRAARVAAALRDAGVVPGDTVGVFLDPSAHLVVAVWGILRAGATYLPLAVDYPAERIAYMAADSALRNVVTGHETDELARRILPAGVRTVRATDPIADSDSGIAQGDGHVPVGPAYTIYTSGTTGAPKGVVIPHRAIANQMSWLAAELGLRWGARILLKTPVSFDAAQWELLANAVGATVVVAPAGTHINPDDLLARVVRDSITVLQCVPTIWAELAALPGLGAATTLRTVASGGEALPTALAQRLREALPHARAINLYGPTEAAINATWFDFTTADLTGTAIVPIGAPVDGCVVAIVDDRDHPVSNGETGELLIAGIQLAEGYRNRPGITDERFPHLTLEPGDSRRWYRTGDLVRRRPDGHLAFIGRNDEQVKVNGHRVEANEVRVWIEKHDWVRTAAVVPWVSERGTTQLAGFIELDPDEAPLMDQDRAGRHHRSKSSRTQVTAQLADLGLREITTEPEILLFGAEPTEDQRRRVFARKTYRTFTADPLDLASIEAILRQLPGNIRPASTAEPPAPGDGRAVPAGLPDSAARELIAPAEDPAALTPGVSTGVAGRGSAVEPARRAERLTAQRIGVLLRWLGPFRSPDRLLPKYFYASPGALNATRIYLETGGLPGLAAGVYYFHPLRHALYRVSAAGRAGVRVHLVGLPEVIESVYSTNVREVLHFEAGHILGVLDEVSAEFGWQVRTVPAIHGLTEGVATASVEIGPPDAFPDSASPAPEIHASVRTAADAAVAGGPAAAVGERSISPAIHVQVHGNVGGARHGLYEFTGDGLRFVSDGKIERRHVIAINQRSYDRAAFAVVLAVEPGSGWDGFTELGRALAHLQQIGSRKGIGFMSAGYASLTGRDLPSARRFDQIRGVRALSYFALAGPVDPAQVAATDMGEDAVHMKGPEELLKDDLRAVLPSYMVPPTIHVLERIPLSQNGKQDRAALAELAVALGSRQARPSDPPATAREAEVARIWSEVLGYEPVYRADDFFAQGGNSMSALRLIRALDERLGVTLPVQTIFRAPTLAELATATAGSGSAGGSRFLRLDGGAEHTATTVLWPGLGGYPMSLRTLAGELAHHGHAVYGVQARGLNPGEMPHDSLDALIADDLAELLDLVLPQPFRIVGYSFGARVAAEVAQRLVAAGHDVEELVLIAPGSPVIPGIPDDEEVRYDSTYFKRVLASVFSARIDPAYVAELDKLVTGRTEFIDLVVANEPGFDRETVERIVAVVEHTYRFRSHPATVDQDLLDRGLYLRARGDGPSFADIPVAPLRLRTRPVSNLPYRHYDIVNAGALDIAAAVLEQTTNRELV
ncbi:amino acid adenylation domain-containing protein [Nocardia sp. NPDC127526]|uniref:amino acid adenylation domain-containing protein n=1 Tax=Nocardia sp. NPDC127526 TaxID=3345393 RepID=UPI00363A3878